MLRVYYAHPLSLYDTDTEARDIATLRNVGYFVVNPNEPAHKESYERIKRETGNGMGYFLGLADTCHVGAYRAFPDGRIPAGVHMEMKFLMGSGRFVFEIPTNIDARALSVDETREYLDLFSTGAK